MVAHNRHLTSHKGTIDGYEFPSVVCVIRYIKKQKKNKKKQTMLPLFCLLKILFLNSLLMTHDSRLTVGPPVFIEGTTAAFFQGDICRLIVQESDLCLVSWEATLSSWENIGLSCSAILYMDGVPTAFCGGWTMLRPLYHYCYDSRFPGCISPGL